jgi:hypothetical protein
MVPLTVDIVVVGEEEAPVIRQEFEILYLDDVMEYHQVGTLQEFIFGRKHFYAVECRREVFLIFAAIFSMAVMHCKAVFPQEFGTFLHITLNAADDPVVFADVKDVFHSACSR